MCDLASGQCPFTHCGENDPVRSRYWFCTANPVPTVNPGLCPGDFQFLVRWRSAYVNPSSDDEVVEAVPQNCFQDAITKRWTKCIDVDGDYMEKLCYLCFTTQSSFLKVCHYFFTYPRIWRFFWYLIKHTVFYGSIFSPRSFFCVKRNKLYTWAVSIYVTQIIVKGVLAWLDQRLRCKVSVVKSKSDERKVATVRKGPCKTLGFQVSFTCTHFIYIILFRFVYKVYSSINFFATVQSCPIVRNERQLKHNVYRTLNFNFKYVEAVDAIS